MKLKKRLSEQECNLLGLKGWCKTPHGNKDFRITQEDWLKVLEFRTGRQKVDEVLTDSMIEFIKVRMEQTPNNAQIARDVVNKFNADINVESLRTWISGHRHDLKIIAKRAPIKRLFFDIETGYYILKIRAWQLKNFQTYFNPDDIEKEKEILCISYKWQDEDKVHTLDNRMGEKKMLKDFIKIMAVSYTHLTLPTKRIV